MLQHVDHRSRQKRTPLRRRYINSKRTLQHYSDRADAFYEGTRDHDVSQNIEALLEAIEGEPPFRILDLGCGPGRDLQDFKDRGHDPVGIDGCSDFRKMAREEFGFEVLDQDFLALDLSKDSFDGIFANATLFHVPSQEFSRVLSELHAALRPRGVLFMSNPRGNYEGYQGERYCNFMEYDRYEGFLEQSGFEILSHYYRPKDLPREEQPWLCIVSRKR